MPNTLTGLIPDLYTGLNVVSRELVGFIPAVSRSGDVARAAVGQQVRYPIPRAAVASDIAPAMNAPEPGDQEVDYGYMAISKSRGVDFGWVGEEQRGLDTGPGTVSVQAQFIAEGIRTLTNEIESDLASVAKLGASRAHGTAGTTPFASGVGATAQLRKILVDNGAPMFDRQLVLNSTAGAAMLTNTQLTKANEAADDTMLRQGVYGNLHNFDILETGQSNSHTKGTGAGYLVNGSPAVGDTTIPIDTGTGTILAGDVVTFAGDANKYVVKTGVDGAGNLVLQSPGLRVAPADNATVSVGDDYEGSVGFSRSAVHLAMRLPELPEEGDIAIDRMTIIDPRSGMLFEVSIYPGYRKVRYEIAAAWGVHASKSNHIALLLG